ncbi:MAG: hypothetical protein JF614_28190 [Acidobacteria bacterium]|nr:hypothetical protein [Acidobacteriota bacterium]
MSSELSVAEILANLEAQMAVHRERADHHAQQAAFHQEQRDLHAAEYESIARHYEAFKASAGAATEIAVRVGAVALSAETLPPVKLPLPSRLVARLVAEVPAGHAFGSRWVAEEVNRRFASELRQPLDSRLASTALRRLLTYGELRLVQKGTAHHEALYARE